MRNIRLLFFIILLSPSASFCAGPAASVSIPINCMQVFDVNQRVSPDRMRSCFQDIVDAINETSSRSRQQVAEKNGELSQLKNDWTEQNKNKDAKIEQLENRIKSLESALDNLKKEIRPSKPKAKSN
jgi:hypothetical protein